MVMAALRSAMLAVVVALRRRWTLGVRWVLGEWSLLLKLCLAVQLHIKWCQCGLGSAGENLGGMWV